MTKNMDFALADLIMTRLGDPRLEALTRDLCRKSVSASSLGWSDG